MTKWWEKGGEKSPTKTDTAGGPTWIQHLSEIKKIALDKAKPVRERGRVSEQKKKNLIPK